MLKRTIFADCDEGRPTVVAQVTDVNELVALAKEYHSTHSSPDQQGYDHWSEMPRVKAFQCALEGDNQYVPGAIDMLAAVDAALPPTSGAVTVRSPFGGRVDLSDWLSESPTPMRRRVRRITDRGLVQIFLPYGPSASLSSADLIPRGNAIMALVMKIQQYRPVQVWLYDETVVQGTNSPFYWLIGVNTQPLSLAHVGFAVSHPAFFRHIGFQAEEQCGAHAAHWPHDIYQDGYPARRNARLGVQPEDLVLSSATDWNPLIRKPIEWIKSELQRMGIEA